MHIRRILTRAALAAAPRQSIYADHNVVAPALANALQEHVADGLVQCMKFGLQVHPFVRKAATSSGGRSCGRHLHARAYKYGHAIYELDTAADVAVSHACTGGCGCSVTERMGHTSVPASYSCISTNGKYSTYNDKAIAGTCN